MRRARTSAVVRTTRSAALGAFVALVAFASNAHAQQLRRPVACDDCIANWYYFDHDATGGIEDWSCAASTYDGHRGSDFSLRGNLGAIDAGNDIVATADGMVTAALDGFFDRCTACGGTDCGTSFGSGYGNHVVIEHGSRKIIYAHMRTGSVRVSVGDRVNCGQPIGQIGSSGCTTGAHVHVETRPPGGASTAAYDPFAGGCSAGPSAWVEQGPHRGMPSPMCEGAVTPPPDAGMMGADAGTTPGDGGTAGDGGAPAADGGPETDAGGIGMDGGAIGRDAGTGLGVRSDGGLEGGCGCVVAGPPRVPPLGIALALGCAGLALRRAKRMRTAHTRRPE